MDENRVMKEFRSVKKIWDIESRMMAISEIRVTVLRVSVKWTRKFKNTQNIKEKKQNSKMLITSQNSTSVPTRIRSEVSSSENK